MLSIDIAMTLLILFASFAEEGPSPATRPADSEPAREIVFKVSGLECALVSGVGCGHLLAPTLSQIEQIERVERAYSNWTGTMLRITAAPSADPQVVAQHVEKFFAQRQQDLRRLAGEELTRSLREQDWRGTDRIVELSSYEFHTFARNKIDEFARDEQLDPQTTAKLHTILDEVWDKSAEGLGTPQLDGAAYASYWQARRQKLLELFTAQTKQVLSAQQMEKLLQHCAGL